MPGWKSWLFAGLSQNPPGISIFFFVAGLNKTITSFAKPTI